MLSKNDIIIDIIFRFNSVIVISGIETTRLKSRKLLVANMAI